MPNATVPANAGGLPAFAPSDLSESFGEVRVQDLALAARLGFARDRDIRKLILRHADELRAFGPLAEERKPRHGGADRSRPGPTGRVHWLNRQQAILITILADTPTAAAVRHAIVHVFDAWLAARPDRQLSDGGGHLWSRPATPARPVLPSPATGWPDPLPATLAALLPAVGDTWSGTPTALLGALAAVGRPTAPGWPTGPQALSMRLDGLPLCRLGLTLARRRSARAREILLSRVAPPPSRPPRLRVPTPAVAPRKPLDILRGWAAIGGALGLTAAQAQRAGLPVITLGGIVSTTPEALAAYLRRRLAAAAARDGP